MNKQKIADNLRRHLERRLSVALGCEPEDLEVLKLGGLIHLAFILHGDQESISGFSTCIRAVLELVGHEIVWADPAKVEDEQPKVTKVVVN